MCPVEHSGFGHPISSQTRKTRPLREFMADAETPFCRYLLSRINPLCSVRMGQSQGNPHSLEKIELCAESIMGCRPIRRIVHSLEDK
jgi:hypothetical protein